MSFWQIKSPDYESDYRHSYINGSLDHPFSLPGVECDVCHNVWGGSRILPFECPEIYRNHKNILNGWPINRIDHENLQKSLMNALNINGNPFFELRPGDRFHPCYLDVPSQPRADFLWSSIGSMVVSEKIKNLLHENCNNEIATCSVSLRKIGKREAKLPPPIPSTGEPEDIIEEVKILKDKKNIGSYFEILIKNESEYPPGGTPVNICKGCNRPEINNSKRKIKMTSDMWKGNKIFFLATTLYIVITDDLKNKLEHLNPTNVVFEKF